MVMDEQDAGKSECSLQGSRQSHSWWTVRFKLEEETATRSFSGTIKNQETSSAHLLWAAEHG